VTSASQSHSRGDILVVDDTKANLKLLMAVLGGAGYRVRPATDGELALRSIRAKSPDLVLLDVKMPGIDGYEVCRRLKADEATSAIPVIFISASVDNNGRVMGFEAGGVDFITKPFSSAEVLARVDTHLSLRHAQVELERRAIELKDMAETDELTGLLNRRGFMLLGENSLRTAEAAGQPVAVMYADIDGMKGINDTHGHPTGDEALRETAAMLRDGFRSSDLLGRVGGDEFAVLAVGIGEREMTALIERIERRFAARDAGGSGPPLAFSMGAAYADKDADGRSLDRLIEVADERMYAAKQAKRG
jgi:diguanylate cyclase (GGDEF)-like protein